MSNPYLNWPLWHYFTLHFQNLGSLASIIDQFRAVNESGRAMDVHLIKDNAKDIVVYNFVEDRIDRLDKYPDAFLITGPSNLSNMLRAKTLSARALTIVKARPEDGGDMIPLIGSAIYMAHIIALISSTIKGVPYDFRAKLSNEDNAKVEMELSSAVYKAPGIARILASYKECGIKPQEEENLANSIASRISLFIQGRVPNPTNQAINIETGKIPMKKNDKIIQEYRVQLDNNPPLNIKFSFPSGITEAKMRSYIRMLEENFKAVRVHAPSEEERRATVLNPVRIEGRSISSIFGQPEEFSQYIAKMNKVERPEIIETSALLANIPAQEEQEEMYEDH